MHATEADCTAAGGAYMGDDMHCAGANCPGPCPGGLYRDGAVDVIDLLVLLQAWGPCP